MAIQKRSQKLPRPQEHKKKKKKKFITKFGTAPSE